MQQKSLKGKKNILKQLNGAIDTLSQSTKADDVAKLKKLENLRDLLSDTTIDKAAFRMDPKDTLTILGIEKIVMQQKILNYLIN